MFNEEEVWDTEGYNEEELNTDTEINTNVTELNKNNENNYETEEIYETVNINNLKIDDFVKVKFETVRGNFEEYVGQITEIEEDNLLERERTSFLRKNQSMRGCFSFPFITDEAYVGKDQVIKKLKVIKEKRGNYQFE